LTIPCLLDSLKKSSVLNCSTVAFNWTDSKVLVHDVREIRVPLCWTGPRVALY
jgi:hypothetical protein